MDFIEIGCKDHDSIQVTQERDQYCALVNMVITMFYFLEYRTMENVQKPSNSVCYTPSPEPFRIYHLIFLLVTNMVHSIQTKLCWCFKSFWSHFICPHVTIQETDFQEVWYFGVSLKFVDTFQFWCFCMHSIGVSIKNVSTRSNFGVSACILTATHIIFIYLFIFISHKISNQNYIDSIS
jgi:hypothetical protein